jgi:hypothetical protein
LVYNINMELMNFLRHESPEGNYPEAIKEKVEQARNWLLLIKEMKVRDSNISIEEAESFLGSLEEGEMPIYQIEGFAANYQEYFQTKGRK